MFREVKCDQGSDEWFQARLGKITGSIVEKVVTKTGKRSASLDEVVNRAVAELIIGEPDETFQSDAMIRGSNMEERALAFYNYVYNFSFQPCGFLLATDEKGNDLGYGVSPDGIMPGLGLELKCPLAHTHLAYLSKQELPDKYTQQVQAALMVTDFEKWIFGSYHPSFPCVKVEVPRDEKLIQVMRPLVLEASQMVKEKYEILKKAVEATCA